jgi:hypothetical protein
MRSGIPNTRFQLRGVFIRDPQGGHVSAKISGEPTTDRSKLCKLAQILGLDGVGISACRTPKVHVIWVLVAHPDQLDMARVGKVAWLRVFEEYARWISRPGHRQLYT